MRSEVTANLPTAILACVAFALLVAWGCGEGPCKNLRDCPAKSDAGVAALIGCGVEADASAPDAPCVCPGPDAGAITVVATPGCALLCGLE